MTGRAEPAADPLAGLLAYTEREVARRAEGKHPGMVRLHETELEALLALLRRELGTGQAQQAEPIR